MKTRQQIESIARGKRRLRLTIILALALVLLIVASIIVNAVVKKMNEDDNASTAPTEDPETVEGESVYRGTVVAYPFIDDSKITRITVSNNNKDGEYTFLRDKSVDDNFLFTYMEDGEVLIYYPDICKEDPYFEYSDLYAEETQTGYGTLPKLNYLLSGLEAAYFGERIPLSSDPTERAAQYKQFGFEADNTTIVIFDYEDETGASATHKIVIGDKTITGVGYYFMVDDRDYVYNSISTYYDYALLSFYSFVNSALISEGLEGDSTLEPIYTTDFTQWKTELHEAAGDVVADKSEIVISASLTVPIGAATYNANPSQYVDHRNGYSYIDYSDMTVNLSAHNSNEKVKLALVDREVGVYYDPDNPLADKTAAITLTVPSDNSDERKISFGSASSVKYGYEIYEIESIIDDLDDVITVGTPVGENNLIKVAYRYTVNGKEKTPIMSHAVIDLTSATLPADAVSALRALSVGVLDEGERVKFEINYTRENALVTTYQTKVTEIISIFDQENKELDKVENDSVVIYRYQLIVNGVLQQEEETASIDLSEVSSDSDKALKEQLVGRGVSRYLSIIVDEDSDYCEVFKHFEAYEIKEIKYFVTKEEVVSMSFLSNSERDPFYGDSIYENNTDGYHLYGLNDSVCQHVLGLLGGIGENTSQSTGLQGIETVSVGITPKKLYDYKLYKHRIYFEIPRNIVEIYSGVDDDTIPDYTSYERLGFTLYVSDILDDGTRYVACDLYDVITKASNDVFFFLDETFTDFWARVNLIMTDVTHMQNIKVEFGFENLTGSYDLEIKHTEAYLTATGMQIGGTPPKNYYDTHDYITVNVTPEGECTPNKLTQYIADKGYTSASLTDLYKHHISDTGLHNYYFPDSLGTTYFKEFIRTLFYVEFEGAMSAEEQKDAVENYPMLMKMSVKIDTDRDGEDDDEGYYVYEFYRSGDRRVLVRLYETTDSGTLVGGEVSDFYISSYGFRTIVSTFLSLLNAETFDLQGGYN